MKLFIKYGTVKIAEDSLHSTGKIRYNTKVQTRNIKDLKREWVDLLVVIMSKNRIIYTYLRIP
jgi:hypothetical protein